MSTTFFKDFKDFGIRGMKLIREDGENLDIESHREVHRTLAEAVKPLTPVDEGDMLAAWGSTVQGSSRKIDTATALQKIDKPGISSAVVNNAPHALVIDMGRNAANPHGSPQARRGVSKPAMTIVESKGREILQKAVAKVLAE